MNPSTSRNQATPLIGGLAVQTTPQGTINVTDQVLLERSEFRNIHHWVPTQLVGNENVEVMQEETEFGVLGCELDLEIEEEHLFDAHLTDSASELEDEEVMIDPLQATADLDFDLEAEAEDLAEEVSWTDDFATFRGEREMFQEEAGPKIAGTEPVDIFTHIWDQPLLDIIVGQSNKYAEQVISAQVTSEGGISEHSRLTKWVETSVEEMYRLISVLILMGIALRGRIDEYWSTGVLGMTEFRRLMSQDRFWLLMRFLHFVDNSKITPAIRGYERKICKIKPIVDYLNLKFMDVYTPTQEISIDESLLLWKGNLSWIQCIRTKAARFGIKTYELCEAKTGYCARLLIYAGKGTCSTEPLYGFTSSSAKTVLQLLQGFLGKGYTLYMDNYYNSVPLSRFLKQKKTDVVGTLNRRKVGTPPEIKNLNEKRLRKGDVVSRHCGDVSVVAWKDLKLVTTVSTFHNNAMASEQRAGQTYPKPIVIKDYNKYMGGVDLKDQKLSMYLLERKGSIKWYIKVFRRLLNISILNAYIIYCSNVGQHTKKMSHRQFRYKLSSQLCERFSLHHEPHPRGNVLPVKLCDRLNASLGHFPKHKCVAEEDRSSKSQVRYKRGRCVQCAKKGNRSQTNMVCGSCDVFLCVGQCYLEYHTVE